MWADNETTEDLLGFRVHADLIQSVIQDDSLLPVSIGVFGDWGGGKTSIMKMLQQTLTTDQSEKNGTVCLYVNGWLFEGYDDAKAALIDTILTQLIQHKRFGVKLKNKACELLSIANLYRIGRFCFDKIGKNSINGYLLAHGVDPTTLSSASSCLSTAVDALDHSGSDGTKEDPNTVDIQNIRLFRDEFGKMISDSNIKRLIVLVDDLDRCSPKRIFENLEAIKLFLNVERTAFVIGADPRIIRHAINSQFPSHEILKSNPSSDVDSAERLLNDCLEKLIQIPYHLPRLSPSETQSYMSLLFCRRHLDLEQWEKCCDAFNSLRKKDRYSVFGIGHIRQALDGRIPEDISERLQFCAATGDLITECLKGNPRQVKRFLNAYLLRKKLAEMANLDNIRDDVLVKLMVLEYNYPALMRELFDWQAKQDGIPQQITDLEEEAIEGDVDDSESSVTRDSSWKSVFCQKWLKIAPKLSGIDLRDYFWIVRDRLQSTLSDVSMVSPVVRKAFDGLFGKTKTIRTAADDLIRQLSELDKDHLLKLVSSHTIKNPSSKESFMILDHLIDLGVPGTLDSIIKCFNDCPPAAINPSVYLTLKQRSDADSSIRKKLLPTIKTLMSGDTKLAVALRKAFASEVN